MPLKPSTAENWHTWPSVKLCFEYAKLHPITLLSMCCLSSCISKTEAMAGFMLLPVSPSFFLSLPGLRSPSSNRMIHYFKAQVVIRKEKSPGRPITVGFWWARGNSSLAAFRRAVPWGLGAPCPGSPQPSPPPLLRALKHKAVPINSSREGNGTATRRVWMDNLSG